MKKKIVIIGAGPAGLTAGYELLSNYQDKYEVTILEKTSDIGGISKTINHNGNRMDIGGHRFFSKDDRVMQWWKNILPVQGQPSYDDKILGRKKFLENNNVNPEKDTDVMLIRNRVSRIYYKGNFFDYPISFSLDMLKKLGFVNSLKIAFSYIKSCFHKLPENSLENFYINRFGKVLYTMFFENYTEKVWGRHPRDISSDWGTQRIKGLSISKLLKNIVLKKFKNKSSKNIETSLIEQFLYPKYGPGQLWQNVAEKIKAMGGEIIKNCEVNKIILNNSSSSIDCVMCSMNGQIISVAGDIYLSSMPVKNLISSMGTQISGEIKSISDNLPYRDFITVGLLLDDIKLKNETNIPTIGNIIPDCWLYVQDKAITLGRIQIFNNWSPYMLNSVENEIWIGLEYFCDKNDFLWEMRDEDLLEFAKKELIKMNIVDENQCIYDFHCERVEKAYPAYFDSYEHIDKVQKQLDLIDNLICIGRNGQHRYNNMDHSMLTAFKAVEYITNQVKSKAVIWNINTEKSYHESK